MSRQSYHLAAVYVHALALTHALRLEGADAFYAHLLTLRQRRGYGAEQCPQKLINIAPWQTCAVGYYPANLRESDFLLHDVVVELLKFLFEKSRRLEAHHNLWRQ